MLEPASIVKAFETSLDEEKFSAGEVIFTSGEKGEVMYGVIEGEIELILNGKAVETIKIGDVFGEGALVREDHVRVTTAKAKTDCRLGVLHKERFMFLIQETPFFALLVINSLSERLISIKNQL